MSDKKVENKAKNASTDPELDELLDSALEDFSKSNEGEAKKTEAAKTTDVEGNVEETKPEADAAWTDDFIKQAAAQFETNMASILSGTGQQFTPEQLKENFSRMAEAASQVVSNPQALEPTPQSNDFAAAISQTLQNLSIGAENLQNPFSENDILSLFGGPGGANPIVNDQNTFLPFMQGMMQSLLSKDVLYPSLKDILERFPAWLETNKATLEASEYERYCKQMQLMKEVCAQLESEKDDDAEQVKRERFEQVLQLMQKMQDLGHPPTELVGETNPGLQFDAQGNPILPPDLNMMDPNQCVLM